MIPDKVKSPRWTESGQVTMLFAMMMSIFLLAFIGFATDYSSFWFERQAVQGAADATCQAAAVDLLLYATLTFPTHGNFTPGSTAVSCATSSTAAPCMIAKYNGYDATQTGVTVNMAFPQTISGFTAPSGVTWPFVTVDITKQAPTYFSGLLTRQSTVNVHAAATCGILAARGSGTVLVLRPYPQITTFTLAAGSTMKIAGGSSVGIQVDADSSHATSFGSGAKADLSQGGLNNTGSDFAVTGTQTDPGSSVYVRGSSGQWLSPDLPELNPFQGVTPPTKPGTNGSGPTGTTGFSGDGCPDTHKCTQFIHGYYASGITVGSSAKPYVTAIFEPGIYYLDGDLTVSNGSTVRMAIPTGHAATDGVLFYFNTGKPNITAGDPTHDSVSTMSSTYLTCNGNAPPAFGSVSIPANLTGNVLVAQCTTDGTWTNDNSGKGSTNGTIRGLLFFINPNQTTVSASLAGSANTVSVYAGSEYIHTYSSTCLTTSTCYQGYLTITGAVADGLITWGDIIADTLTINGAYETQMLMIGSGTTPTSKIAMIQ